MITIDEFYEYDEIVEHYHDTFEIVMIKNYPILRVFIEYEG